MTDNNTTTPPNSNDNKASQKDKDNLTSQNSTGTTSSGLANNHDKNESNSALNKSLDSANKDPSPSADDHQKAAKNNDQKQDSATQENQAKNDQSKDGSSTSKSSASQNHASEHKATDNSQDKKDENKKDEKENSKNDNAKEDKEKDSKEDDGDEKDKKLLGADMEFILKEEEKLKEKLKDSVHLERFTTDISLFISLVKDYYQGNYRKIPYKSISSMVIGLVYILNPIDIIPDFIPVIGYVDDALVIAFCLKMVEKDLREYQAWKEQQGDAHNKDDSDSKNATKKDDSKSSADA